MSNKIKVGSLLFKGKNLIDITAAIEFIDGFPRDTVFITIREGLSNDNSIRMQITSSDLRDLTIALGDLYEDKMSDYSKITQSTSKKGEVYTKRLDLGFSEEFNKKNDKKLQRFYINIYQGNNKISLSLNKINIRTCIEQCRHLATKLEEKLFVEQGKKFDNNIGWGKNDDR